MGCLLRGIKREQVRRGQVIIAPGSMKPVKKFQAQVYVRQTYFAISTFFDVFSHQVLTKEEGEFWSAVTF
jgi:translation elongation factor EF-Tu-like GTPase